MAYLSEILDRPVTNLDENPVGKIEDVVHPSVGRPSQG